MIRKKRRFRLGRLIPFSKGRKQKLTDDCGETDSSFENPKKAQNSAAKGLPTTPVKASRRAAPSTPTTLPETSTPHKNGRSKENSFFIMYSDAYPSPEDLAHENASGDLSQVARVQTDCFDQQPNDDSNSTRRKLEIVSAFEIDQRQQVISTEDDIISLRQEDPIDLDLVNRQLFQKLEESQKHVLASIVHPERITQSLDGEGQKAFSKIPEHPALGNLEKYRSGLVANSLPRSTSTATAQGGVNSSFIEESDRSVDKGSVSEGLKSLWDETTKNLESMNKVFLSCALDWKQEARENLDEIAYTGENGKKMPLNGVWLAVPDRHVEDISLLSYPRESQPDEIPVLKRGTTTIVEEDEPIQENCKSRYNLWS